MFSGTTVHIDCVCNYRAMPC